MEEAALEVKIANLDQKLRDLDTKTEEAKKEIFGRLIKIETQNAKTEEQYKQIINELNAQKSQLSNIIGKLDELSRKPVRRYETVVTTVLQSIFAAIAGYVAAKFF